MSITKIVAVIALTLMLPACEASRQKERAKVVKAYADVLIITQAMQGDSLARLKSIDSVLKSYGYDSRADLIEAIRDAGEDPDAVRSMMDSTQRRLDLISKDSLR